MPDACVLGGVRNPFARYGSSLSHIRVDDLLGMTMKGACRRRPRSDPGHCRRLCEPGP